MQPRLRFVAVDAPFLIALAKGDPSCEAAVDIITRRLRFYITVLPATLVALFDIAESEKNAEFREHARLAEKSISTWGFVCDELNDLQEVMATGAFKLLNEKTGLSESLCQLIAETSVLKCTMLLTDDQSLHAIPKQNLEILLMDRDLDGFFITDPETFSEVATEVLRDGI